MRTTEIRCDKCGCEVNHINCSLRIGDKEFDLCADCKSKILAGLDGKGTTLPVTLSPDFPWEHNPWSRPEPARPKWGEPWGPVIPIYPSSPYTFPNTVPTSQPTITYGMNVCKS